jgi:alpha-glucosidase
MLRIEQNQEQFQIFFKDLEIIRHSNTKPCVEIGTGQENYRMQKKHYGFYKPKDYNLWMRKLRSYQIIEKTEYRIKIEFENLLKVKLEVVSDRLEITLMLLNLESHSENWNRFTLNIPANKNESIYGLGEQFSVLNLRGKCVPLWTQEPGLGRDHSIPAIMAELYMGAGGAWHTTYFPQPTFISSRNYFVHVESYAYAKFDFRNRHYHRIHIWEIPKRLIIDVKSKAVELIQSLSAYLGRQPSLPDWAIEGMWLGIGGGLEENNRWSVQQKLKHALDAGVKVSAIWSQDWTGLYKASRLETRLFWNWRYDNQRYLNLPEFIKSLNDQGIKFLGYNNCFLMKHGDLYKEAYEKGYLIKKKDGNVYNLRMGSFSAGMLDLTNPQTWQWIKEIIKENMLGIGLNGWMCDYGEYLPIDCALFSREDPKVYHNNYPVLWAQVNYEATKEAGKLEGKDAVVFFNRSGNTGTSKYAPMIWAGDQMATFSIDNGLASVISAGISLGFCGIGHFHSDIGGLFTIFGIKREKELFMRWTELATFTCVMRTHEGHHYEDKINWTFDSDEETLLHFAKFSRIHSHLKPYTRHLLDEYQATGLSLIRHPYIHYESDQCLHRLQYQYLYGRDLLIAPVYLKRIKIWKVYLPEDDWVHVWSNKSYSGGWIDVPAPIGEPPVFYRASSKFSQLFSELKTL